jgi:hypothetical protein
MGSYYVLQWNSRSGYEIGYTDLGYLYTIPECKITDMLPAFVSWTFLFMDVYQQTLVVAYMLLCKMINHIIRLCGGCGSMNH